MDVQYESDVDLAASRDHHLAIEFRSLGKRVCYAWLDAVGMYWHRFVYSRRANNPAKHQQDLSVSRFSLDKKCAVKIVTW
jgi:hypothetical protein